MVSAVSNRSIFCVFILCFGLFASFIANAETIRVAVASNFLGPAKQLIESFQRETGYQVNLSSGSTGKLYSQIINGAPFDVFMAADQRSTQRLKEQGRAVAIADYAVGELVLWSKLQGLSESVMQKKLESGDFVRLAHANPKTAPYGKAAIEVISGFKWYRLKQRQLLRGENITQAYQFALSGNADFAFIAKSQLALSGDQGSRWTVPQQWYTPIIQSMAMLKRSKTKSAANDWFTYIQSRSVQKRLMTDFGYALPVGDL